MRISFISAAGLLVLGCGLAAPRPDVMPTSACRQGAAADAPEAGVPVPLPLFIEAKALAVITPENVPDAARAMDALLQAMQSCMPHRRQEHP